MPSCRTEPLVTPENAVAVCSFFTKECAKHTSFWQLKTFHIEVSKVYFGCKMYYLIFPRDIFWHYDNGLVSGHWRAASRNTWLKHHSLWDLEVSPKSTLFSMGFGSDIIVFTRVNRCSITPHITSLIYMTSLFYHLSASNFKYPSCITSCRCCVGCGAIWASTASFQWWGEELAWGVWSPFPSTAATLLLRKLKQELVNTPWTPCCSLSVLCAYQHKSWTPFTSAVGKRFSPFPPFHFTPCNFSFLEPSAGQGLLRWNLFNIWHFPTSYFSPSAL